MNGNNKFMQKLEEFAGRLGGEIHLRSLRDTFTTIMPIYILASIAVLLNNTVFTWIFSGQTLENLQYWGNIVINGTLNISGLFVAPLIGYYLAKNKNFGNPLMCSIIAMSSLVIMMPDVLQIVPVGAEEAVTIRGVLAFSNTGTSAMFAGIVCGLLFTEIFVRIANVKKLQINLGENIPPSVARSFAALIPVIIVLLGVATISACLYVFFDTNLIKLITTIIQEPLRHISSGIVGTCIIYAIGNSLWFFGIHQTVVNGSILEPLLLINLVENTAAYSAGLTIPNAMNGGLLSAFGQMGGSGCTVCLLIAIFLRSKDKAARNVAKLSVGPAIFNINEPVIFGLPIVYNLSLIIPFILVPTMSLVVAYTATIMGFMNYCVIQVPWTCPILIHPFLSTGGDWRAIVVQLIIIVIGVLMYLPFVKLNDRVVAKQAALENEANN